MSVQYLKKNKKWCQTKQYLNILLRVILIYQKHPDLNEFGFDFPVIEGSFPQQVIYQNFEYKNKVKYNATKALCISAIIFTILTIIISRIQTSIV